jgi:hypothetical protein
MPHNSACVHPVPAKTHNSSKHSHIKSQQAHTATSTAVAAAAASTATYVHCHTREVCRSLPSAPIALNRNPSAHMLLTLLLLRFLLAGL